MCTMIRLWVIDSLFKVMTYILITVGDGCRWCGASMATRSRAEVQLMRGGAASEFECQACGSTPMSRDSWPLRLIPESRPSSVNHLLTTGRRFIDPSMQLIHMGMYSLVVTYHNLDFVSDIKQHTRIREHVELLSDIDKLPRPVRFHLIPILPSKSNLSNSTFMCRVS